MVVVEARRAAWYRSQVAECDLRAASMPGKIGPHGHPVIDYDAVGPDGTPILNMLKKLPDRGQVPVRELCHTDLTAIITGPDVPGDPNRWLFRPPGPLPGDDPLYPRPWEPYREFAIMYHDLPAVRRRSTSARQV